MTHGAAVRGCGDYYDLGSTYQPTAEVCAAYCAQNGGDACEWEISTGACWVEFGTGCYVEDGYGGWYAAVLTPTPASQHGMGVAAIFFAATGTLLAFLIAMFARVRWRTTPFRLSTGGNWVWGARLVRVSGLIVAVLAGRQTS